MPPTALALASGHVHALALLDALSQIIPEGDQVKLANLQTMLTGLLLGQDLRTKILPRSGRESSPISTRRLKPMSRRAARLEAGRGHAAWPFPVVLVISMGADSEPIVSLGAIPSTTTALAAFDNALRTVLAMVAMDEKRSQGRSRIATHTVAGTTVTTLDPPVPFAYAVDRARSRLILSTSPAPSARYLESRPIRRPASGSPGSRPRRLKTPIPTRASTSLPSSTSADKHRERLVQTLAARQKRPVDEVDRDLSHVLAIARLFRAGFITSRFDADATAVHRTVGLIRHEQVRSDSCGAWQRGAAR